MAFFQLLRADLEAGVCAGFDDHRRAFGNLDHVRIGYPVRCRNDRLVTGVQGGKCQVEKTLFASTAYQDLVGFIIQAVVPFELRNNRFFQGRRTIHSRVFGLAVVDGLDSGLFDVIGGVEVRLASAEADNVLAGRTKSAALLVTARVGEGLIACTRLES